MTKSTIAVFGAGGHAKVVIDAILTVDATDIQLYDTRQHQTFLSPFNLKITPLKNYEDAPTQSPAIIAIGDNTLRAKIAEACPHHTFTSVIHKSALVHKSAKIGHGVYIGAGVIIQPDTIIGDHAIINTGAIIEHDVKIGKFCHIAPGCILTGNVTVGDFTLVGAGVTIIPGQTIGHHTIIGAGAVVISPIADHTKVAGVPAKPL